MLSLSAIALAAVVQSDPSLTYESAAKPLGAVLRDISQQTGAEHSAAAELRLEPIQVSWRSRPLSQARSMVAAAVGGSWRQDGSKWILQVDPETRKRDQAEELELRIKAMESGVQDLLKSSPIKPLTAEEATRLVQEDRALVDSVLRQSQGINLDDGLTIEAGGGEESGPAANVLKGLIRRLLPRDLASISRGSRVVFSNRPTPMQRQISSGLSDLLAEFEKDRNMLLQAQSSLPALDSRIRFRSSLSGYSGKVQMPVGKVLLAVTRPESQDELLFSIAITDQNGNVVGRSSSSITVAAVPLEASLPSAEGVVALNSDQMAIAAAIARTAAAPNRMVISDGTVSLSSTGERVPPTPPAAVRALADPVAREPFSLFISPMLSQWGQAVKSDFVAALPDRGLVPLASRLAGGRVAYSALSDELAKQRVEAVKTEGGWVIRSRFPTLEAAQRVNRASLAEVTRQLAAQGYLRLAPAAQYVARQSWPTSLDLAYASALSQLAKGVLFDDKTVRQFLKIYHHLTPTPVGGKAEWNLALLSGPARSAAEQLVYGRESLQRGGRSVSITMGGGGAGAQAPDTLASEPTETFPTGLPQAGRLRMSWNQEETWLGVGESPQQAVFHTARSLAIVAALQNNDPNFSRGVASAQELRFQQANTTSIQCSVEINPSFQAMSVLRDSWVSAPGPGIAYADLPKAFLDQVKAMTDQMKVMGGFSSGPRTNRPPQP